MTQHEVARTLVKSAPELWEVCSDPDSLSRHLEAFGEIRITRVESETTVAWEGERASGTVRIEPSGWGTRVILTATEVAIEEPAGRSVEPEPVVVADPEPVTVADPERLTAADSEPVTVADPEPVTAADLVEPPRAEPELPVEDPPAEPEQSVPRPGFFRRLGGVLFKSLVTPVNYPEDAFPASETPEAAQAGAEPEAAQLDPEPEGAMSGPEPEGAMSGPEPEPEPAVAAAPAEPTRSAPNLDPGTVLAGVLDKLGADHHRPFSRS